MLERKWVKVTKLLNIFPGVDWVNEFCKRHKEVLREMLWENIKRSRADVTTETINSYYYNLQRELQDISPKSSQTCFVDNPGRKKVWVK